MKRIDILTFEEIKSVITGCCNGNCHECKYYSEENYRDYRVCINSWLNKFISIKPRVANINTKDDLVKAYRDYKTACAACDSRDQSWDNSCNDCPYKDCDYPCFINYLAESIIG